MAGSHFFILAVIVSCALAHTCLIAPPQRGPMEDINTEATADCFLTTGPCGGIPQGRPELAMFRDSNFTVTWQKNENHWTTANPGSFNLSWADAADPTTFNLLYSFVDTDTPPLTLYTYILDVNTLGSKMGILQLAYVAPSLPATFYQCSDVVVV